MSLDEHRRVVQIVAEQARGRVAVVAGAGSNDTRKAIALSRELKDVGATHLLHVAPMYSKPPQRGMAVHFRAIVEVVNPQIGETIYDGAVGSAGFLVRAYWARIRDFLTRRRPDPPPDGR